MANNADTLQRAYDNYCRIQLMLTEAISGTATQQQIDTLLSTAEGLGIPRAKITYSLDGETYNWTEFQTQLGTIMANLRKQMIFSAGPFEIRSRAR